MHSSEKSSETNSINPRFAVPIDYGVRGADAIRQHIRTAINEQSYLQVAGSLHTDARAYVIYGALDEAEKAAMSLMGFDEVTAEQLSEEVSRVPRNVLALNLEQLRGCVRRLVELLVNLVLFCSTNDQEHFRHLLMLEELVSVLRDNQDLARYHHAPNAGLTKRSEEMVGRIVDLKVSHPTLSRSWYAGRGVVGMHAVSVPNPGNLLSSASERINLSLRFMTPSEKIHLGFTYGEGYSEPSGTMHYSVSSLSRNTPPEEQIRAARQIGLLIMSVLLRCHELLGRPEIRFISQLADIERSNPTPAKLVQDTMVSNIEIGDFVVVHDYGLLAEVLEIADSNFGYRSFRARFLAEPSMLNVEEDWFPARSIQTVYTKQYLLETITSLSPRIPDDERAFITEVFATVGEAERLEALRDSLKVLWNLGLGKIILENLYRQKKKNGDTVAIPALTMSRTPPLTG